MKQFPVFSLTGLLAFCAATAIAQAQMIIVSSEDFTTQNAWSVDIDGDGVDELRRSTASATFGYFDNTTAASTFVFTSTPDRALSNQNAAAFDGTFTASSDTTVAYDDQSYGLNTSLDYAILAHGTDTSNLVDAVSLVGFIIESPTSGTALGWFTGVSHNDDYYIIYHDFGDIAEGQSVTLDYSGALAAASAVPEPSTYAAIFGGLALAGSIWRRRRGRSNFLA